MKNVINMEDVIIHSGNMDGSDLTSYSTDMQEKEIVPTSSTNSIIDVVKSECKSIFNSIFVFL